MFLSDLHVVHLGSGKDWKLTRPLVWEGKWQYFVIREDFVTDFASIPKAVRWLLDNSGRNAEAAVLHDAVWRESKRKDNPRVDPWFADGIFRRSLRETGTPALTRGLMWFAVRAAAMFGRRFGKLGPPWWIKILQLLGVFVLGVVATLGPTIVVVMGLVVYWVVSWIVAVPWHFAERARKKQTNWPWPAGPKSVRDDPPARELLIIVDKPEAEPGTPEFASSSAGKLAALFEGDQRSPSGADIDAALGG